MNSLSTNIFSRNKSLFYPVISFDPSKDKLMHIDLSTSNSELDLEMVEDTDRFTSYIQSKLRSRRCKLGIGGYGEYRALYDRSRVFDAAHVLDEPRRFHLGIDIWGSAGTPVFAPIGGMVHGFAFNDQFGDYGATIILLHQLDGFAFYTLYGHMSLRDIGHLNEGSYVIRGQEIGHFGEPHENGHWPPHLHFQLIFDIGMYRGDYPGVCKYSEREKYLQNCPDPDFILQLNQYISR